MIFRAIFEFVDVILASTNLIIEAFVDKCCRVTFGSGGVDALSVEANLINAWRLGVCAIFRASSKVIAHAVRDKGFGFTFSDDGFSASDAFLADFGGDAELV